MSLDEAARHAGVAPSTLRRWARDGLVPRVDDGTWPPAAVAHARIVARLRARGRSVAEIREATRSGRLAVGYLDDLVPPGDAVGQIALAEAARRTGLAPALIARVYLSLGFSTDALERISESDLVLLDYLAAVVEAGLPLEALLQLARVYGQALAQMADAEVRLFHLYVHEPLLRDGAPGLEVAEELEGLARALLPLRRRSWTTSTGASSRTSSSRTSSAISRTTSRARRSTSGGCAWRLPSPTSRGTRG